MARTVPEYSTRFTGTKDRPNNQRVQVDPGQTSFEENKQFRFFDEWHTNSATGVILDSDILVYKFETVNALNLTTRFIELWEGARTYQVFPDDGNITFAGTLVPQAKVYNTNSNLNEYIAERPVSSVTISRYIGTEVFTSTTPAVTGTAVRTSGVNNQQTITYNESGDRSGIGAGGSFYLVFKQIPLNNDNTQGMFLLNWEEIIGE